MDRIIDLCYTICNNSKRFTKPSAFVFSNKVEGFTQIDALNRSHTAIFKIGVDNHDLGLWFKHPCIYETKDAEVKNFKLRRLHFNEIRDKNYWELLKFDEVFNIGYDVCDYYELQRLLNMSEGDSIEIRNNGYRNVYSSELLRSAFLTDELDEVKLRLTGADLPLRLNYKYGIFDVYCLIAPRIETESLFYLRV